MRRWLLLSVLLLAGCEVHVQQSLLVQADGQVRERHELAAYGAAAVTFRRNPELETRLRRAVGDRLQVRDNRAWVATVPDGVPGLTRDGLAFRRDGRDVQVRVPLGSGDRFRGLLDELRGEEKTIDRALRARGLRQSVRVRPHRWQVVRHQVVGELPVRVRRDGDAVEASWDPTDRRTAYLYLTGAVREEPRRWLYLIAAGLCLVVLFVGWRVRQVPGGL